MEPLPVQKVAFTQLHIQDGDSAPPPESHAPKRSVRDNKFPVFATWFCFLVYGMTDGTTGALSPYIQSFYSISYTVVSLLFLCQVLGYGLMALLNNSLLSHIGRRWAAILGAVLMCTANILIMFGPPFPVVVIAYVFTGFAGGIFESMLNAYAGSLQEASMVLGFLHGFYGLGAAISPTFATQLVVHGLEWHWYYGVLLGAAVINLATCSVAFWPDTVAVIKLQEQEATKRHTISTANSSVTVFEKASDHVIVNASAEQQSVAQARSPLREVLNNRFCLVGALYIFLYLGMEISTGGWIAQYLQKIRNGGESATGFVNSGFWFGLTLGRFILSWPASHLLGEWNACQIFMVVALVFELVFWLAPNIIAASIGVSFMGFFIGPTFPLLMELATKHLPPRLHIAGIGFIASFGSVGGALLPFIIGIGATAQSPKIVPYVLTSLLGGCLIVWCFLPGRESFRFGALSKTA